MELRKRLLIKGACKKLLVLGLIIPLFILSGCATTRFISNPTPPQELKISGKDQNFEVVLDHIILPNGPGSWVKDALWDEYALTLRNFSDKDVTAERFRIIDPRGVYINNGVNPFQLESASKMLANAYKEIGIMTVVGVGSEALLFVAPLVVAPLALVALPVYEICSMNKTFSDVQDNEKISKEFTGRMLTAVALSGNATVTGSIFFPIIPSPKSLVIDYRMKNEMKTLEISLEKLTGLHVAPKDSKKTNLGEKGK